MFSDSRWRINAMLGLARYLKKNIINIVDFLGWVITGILRLSNPINHDRITTRTSAVAAQSCSDSAYASPTVEYAAPAFEVAPTGYDTGYGAPRR